MVDRKLKPELFQDLDLIQRTYLHYLTFQDYTFDNGQTLQFADPLSKARAFTFLELYNDDREHVRQMMRQRFGTKAHGMLEQIEHGERSAAAAAMDEASMIINPFTLAKELFDLGRIMLINARTCPQLISKPYFTVCAIADEYRIVPEDRVSILLKNIPHVN